MERIIECVPNFSEGRNMEVIDSIVNAIEKSGVERVYILIGSNDIGSDAQRIKFFENWDIMLQRIREIGKREVDDARKY